MMVLPTIDLPANVMGNPYRVENRGEGLLRMVDGSKRGIYSLGDSKKWGGVNYTLKLDGFM